MKMHKKNLSDKPEILEPSAKALKRKRVSP